MPLAAFIDGGDRLRDAVVQTINTMKSTPGALEGFADCPISLLAKGGSLSFDALGLRRVPSSQGRTL